MKTVRTTTGILVLGLLASVCPAANPIQSFGYPSVLAQSSRTRPELPGAAWEFQRGNIVPTSAVVAEDHVNGGVVGMGAYAERTAPVETTASRDMAVSASAPGPVTPTDSLNNATGYQPGSQYMAGGWAGCAPVVLPRACSPKWFGGIYGLAMDVSGDRNYWIATSDTDPSQLYLNTRDIDYDVAGGAEVRFGRILNNGRGAVEFVYWGLYPDASYGVISTADVVGNLAPSLDFSNIDLTISTGPGAAMTGVIAGDPNADGVANPLRIYEVRRSYEMYNLEVNLLSGPLREYSQGACGHGGWTTNWLVGFRYLKFDESLRTIYENGDGVINYNALSSPGNSDQAYYDVRTENDLAGAQLGIDSDYAVTARLRLELATRFGIYGNHANQNSRIFNSWDDASLPLSPGQSYNLRSSGNDVSFLGELRLGVNYLVKPHWRVTAGYRVAAATGIARAVNQIPLGNTVQAVNYHRTLDRNGSLILYGGYFGAELGW